MRLEHDMTDKDVPAAEVSRWRCRADRMNIGADDLCLGKGGTTVMMHVPMLVSNSASGFGAVVHTFTKEVRDDVLRQLKNWDSENSHTTKLEYLSSADKCAASRCSP